ncbi:MAG: cob(I)yrinic acid a,c-diamide adenosyltransferase [Calditrichaeota bacterium]|nr:cob(I)yrinic acid a,c-diamide adenosyltransferase [Calditrichota bacterium]
MKIYTRTGDAGTTALYRGGRVSKSSKRIEACGTVDELNSSIGLARTGGLPNAVNAILKKVQNDLFVIGADLATPSSAVKPGDQVARLDNGAERFLEEAIDRLEKNLEPIRAFILPGGSPGAAALHLARSICRRAERAVVSLTRGRSVEVNPAILIYLNRLSDFLFVAARFVNLKSGVEDVFWTPR